MWLQRIDGLMPYHASAELDTLYHPHVLPFFFYSFGRNILWKSGSWSQSSEKVDWGDPNKGVLRNLLFNGIDELGSKSFLDYFREYWCEDGTVNEKRSMVSKSFESRPWDHLQIQYTTVDSQVFTLGSSSWKAITKPPEYPPPQLSFLESIPVFAHCVDCWQIDCDDIYSPSKIVEFHMGKEEFSVLFYPTSSWSTSGRVCLVELRGCSAVFNYPSMEYQDI